MITVRVSAFVQIIHYPGPMMLSKILRLYIENAIWENSYRVTEKKTRFSPTIIFGRTKNIPRELQFPVQHVWSLEVATVPNKNRGGNKTEKSPPLLQFIITARSQGKTHAQLEWWEGHRAETSLGTMVLSLSYPGRQIRTLLISL